MPKVNDKVVIQRPGKSDFNTRQSTLDRIEAAMKTGEGLTVFELMRRTDLSRTVVENALTYYPPCMALVDIHMGVSPWPNAQRPKWATPNTPFEAAPRKFADGDFTKPTIKNKKIAESMSKSRETVIEIAGGSRRKPTNIAKDIKTSFERSHYDALGLERGLAARTALLSVGQEVRKLTEGTGLQDMIAHAVAEAMKTAKMNPNEEMGA